MIYIMMILICIAMWSTGYAITVPVQIQRMVDIAETIKEPEEILASLTKMEKLYLLTSSIPFLLIPLFFFMDIPRNEIYGSILIALALVGVLLRDYVSKNVIVIRVLAIVELIIYSDTIRNAFVEAFI